MRDDLWAIQDITYHGLAMIVCVEAQLRIKGGRQLCTQTSQ